MLIYKRTHAHAHRRMTNIGITLRQTTLDGVQSTETEAGDEQEGGWTQRGVGGE